MKRKSSPVYLITTLLCLAPLLATPFLYHRLPEQIVTHWDFSGNPDGTSSRAFAAIGFPLFMAGMNAFLAFALRTDPKRENASKRLIAVSLWMMPVMSISIYILMMTTALGKPVDPTRYITLGMGVIFVLVGNYLPKSRQSYTVGIKTPWALHDEENWNKTHRLAGPLWVAAGALVALSAFTPFSGPVMLVSLSASSLIPFAYSYLLYRRSQSKD